MYCRLQKKNFPDTASIQMELTPKDGVQSDEARSDEDVVTCSTTNTYKEYTENKTASMGKSQSATITFGAESNQIDMPIDQVDENHYVYRRGSTQIHVQTYAASSASDVINDSEHQMLFNGLKLISALISMIIVVITLVIKIAAAITSEVSSSVEDQYMLTLYVIGFLWTSYYSMKGMCNQQQIKFSKSSQSSNRWLKGVIVLFGLAIVLKDGLEFLAHLMVDLPNCPGSQTLAALSFFHAMYIITQIKYLFRFSKVFIRNCSAGSSTGLMFLIAVNLSVWIASIVDETLIALDKGAISDSGQDEESTTTSTLYNSTSINLYAGDTGGAHGQDSCSCHTEFCATVHVAETFLFPFVIEFCLVASSLLYITWNNVGKQPPPCEGVIKPSYKLHSKYAGAAFGGVAFFVTVLFLILLGTSASDVDVAHKDYYTESLQLILYNSFLIGMETFMMIVIGLGFYLFYRIPRPLEKSSTLDNVLLIICILGPLAINIFILLANIVNPDIKISAWEVTVISPLLDILQCISQLVFILYGLRREPITSANAKENAAHLRFGIRQHIQRSAGPDGDLRSTIRGSFNNKTFLRSRNNSITSVVSRLANAHQPNQTCELHAKSFIRVDDDRLPGNLGTSPAGKKPEFPQISAPAIVVTGEDGDDVMQPDDREKSEDDVVVSATGNFPAHEYLQDDEELPKQSILKIVSKTKVALPDRPRLWLRDVIMFLLIANASLWVFQSLDGTAFTIYPYQSIFYGTSGWTTISMICRPLSIFFRMHSAGCLFEMWSFA